MATNPSKLEQKTLVRQWAYLLPTLLRCLVWIALFAVLYLLRDFFLLIFLTFVFSYIQANGVTRLEAKIKNRTLRVTLVATGLLTVILAIGTFLVPLVKDQAKIFVDRYPSYVQTVDKSLIQLASNYPFLNEFMLFPADLQNYDSSHGMDLRKSPSAALVQQFIGIGEQPEGQNNVKQTLDTLRNIGGYLLTLISAFLLSLLFSFLIVLDLPKLIAGVKGLANTKLRFIYLEVADSIRDFGVVLGRALEAQLFIAIINTILTATGITLIGLGDKVAFISVIVFICSFIPVAGVFISSMPICLIMLQESGIGGIFLAIFLITGIHLVETYILNPKIYGYHMRMNPIVVLIILTIGGKMFHIWGLVLGVPICTYIFGHAIRYKKEDVIEKTIQQE